MATTFTWELQGVTPTEIVPGDDDVLRFAGATFADAVFVGEYNDSTHVRLDGGGDKSSGNDPVNNKFISQSGGTGGDSQADWGDGTEDLDQIMDSEAALHVEVSDAINITVTQAVFYSYDGTTPATPAPGIDVRAAEVGDTNFTQAEGSGNALELADSDAPAMTHDFYIVISKSPIAIGLKPDKLRFEAVIQ